MFVVKRFGNLVSPDAFDLVRRPRDNFLIGCIMGVDGPFGISRNHLNLGVLFLQEATDTADGAASPGGGHEMGDPPLGLLPDLRAGRPVVSLRVDLVVELIGENGVRRILGDRLCLHDVIVGMVSRNGGGSNDHLGAESA